MRRALFATAFGTCGLAWGDAGVTRFCLPAAEAEIRWRLGPGAEAGPVPAEIGAVIAAAQRHLAGDRQDFSAVTLDTAGVSDFDLAVYRLTRAVPAGQVTTYGRIALAMGQGVGAARAVGVALGANPWPLLVPCHRVVAASGRMAGFSAPGGIRTKTRLLALEGAELLSD
jgi:methylated-DNA-[protein]-cysteine S-methyltransferase